MRALSPRRGFICSPPEHHRYGGIFQHTYVQYNYLDVLIAMSVPLFRSLFLVAGGAPKTGLRGGSQPGEAPRDRRCVDA